MSDFEEDRPSKSQRKRDMQELKDLAVRLSELSADTMARISPPELLDAVLAASRIHKGSARKRQIQYVAKLLSKMDTAPVRTIVDEIDASSAAYIQKFHILEQWREDLLSGIPERHQKAMESVCSTYPDIDRQQLRQLIRQGEIERDREQQGPAYRKLFKFLRQAQESA